MNQFIADHTHPLEHLYVQDCEQRIMPEDICNERDLARYYMQRLPSIKSIPILHGSEETLATITPLLDALAIENPITFRCLLILPHGDGFLIANHIENKTVGFEAIASFLRNSTTDSQRLFTKQFTICALRTQLLRCEWVTHGKPISPLTDPAR